MHLRRALLLFAVVLGLAALAAAVSRPSDVDDEPAPSTPPPTEAQSTTPTVSDGAGGAPPTELIFNARKPSAKGLASSSPATVFVDVEDAGMVTIPKLGLSAAAEAHTPARFDLLVEEPGRYPIEYEPAAGDASQPAGTLVVKPDDT